MRTRVAVVGAGIVGLAAASTLRQAGAEVRCFEKATPGQAQSVGLTRIFRHAHGDPALVRLAMRARAGWQAWERRSGRRLVGEEGLIITGTSLVQHWERAMREADAPYRLLTAADVRAILPISRPPDDVALWDPSAGSIRARRTIDFLRADCADSLVQGEVLELVSTNTGMHVRTSLDIWRCDEVLVAAGIGTPRLAAQIGVHIPVYLARTSRFTFALRDPRPDRTLACWIDESGAYVPGLSCYGQPVGTTGQYAIGVAQAGADYPETMEAEEVSRRARAVTQRYVRAALPDLDPEPVAEVQCLHNKTGDPNGDGFGAVRRGATTIVYGNNLFKFAPLLGELLSRAILQKEVPVELRSGALLPLGS